MFMVHFKEPQGACGLNISSEWMIILSTVLDGMIIWNCMRRDTVFMPFFLCFKVILGEVWRKRKVHYAM